MEVKEFVGLPIEVVTKQLKDLNFYYRIIESSEIQKKFDTVLVVKATLNENCVELVTDKFLLKI